jgi:signal transduction histidine kinase
VKGIEKPLRKIPITDDQMVAGLAHAIKNLLGGLKGGRFLVNKGLEDRKMKTLREGWDMVERNIERITTLTTDLLNFCREGEPDLEPVNPNDLIREVRELYRARFQQSGILLTLNLDESMVQVKMDRRGMREAISNLVGNALDACSQKEAGPEPAEVQMKSRLLPDEIVLEVRDNGVGMTRGVRRKLFTVCFSSKGAGGTGLGLLISRKIVEGQGGRIQVRSEPLKGSAFRISLPVRKKSKASRRLP